MRPDTAWIMSELSQLPDHGSLLEREALISDVKLEKQFSGTGPSKRPPGFGVCDVRSVTKGMPVFI